MEATIVEATFVEATLEEATLVEATLVKATLAEATLAEATLIKTTLVETTLNSGNYFRPTTPYRIFHYSSCKIDILFKKLHLSALRKKNPIDREKL